MKHCHICDNPLSMVWVVAKTKHGTSKWRMLRLSIPDASIEVHSKTLRLPRRAQPYPARLRIS